MLFLLLLATLVHVLLTVEFCLAFVKFMTPNELSDNELYFANLETWSSLGSCVLMNDIRLQIKVIKKKQFHKNSQTKFCLQIIVT